MRLALRKRPHHYVKMLRRARELVPADVRLEAVIIGDGPRRAGIERYLAKHGMTDWVTLYGRATHEQIREVYRDADFFVAPATLESFGIAALEARSAGLPVIAHAEVRGARLRRPRARGAAGERRRRHGRADRPAGEARPPCWPTMTRYNRREHPAVRMGRVLEQCEQLYLQAGARPRRAAPRSVPTSSADRTA